MYIFTGIKHGQSFRTGHVTFKFFAQARLAQVHITIEIIQGNQGAGDLT